MKTYVLTMNEVIEVQENYSISISEKWYPEFIESHRDLLEKAADGDGDAANTLWNLALDDGFLDDYNDREVLDSIETYYGCETMEGDE